MLLAEVEQHACWGKLRRCERQRRGRWPSECGHRSQSFAICSASAAAWPPPETFCRPGPVGNATLNSRPTSDSRDATSHLPRAQYVSLPRVFDRIWRIVGSPGRRQGSLAQSFPGPRELSRRRLATFDRSVHPAAVEREAAERRVSGWLVTRPGLRAAGRRAVPRVRAGRSRRACGWGAARARAR